VRGKITTIYDPIITEESKTPFNEVAVKYEINQNDYYYCVSSLLPHKNLETLLKVMAERKSGLITLSRRIS
jgi:hypothetical protein